MALYTNIKGPINYTIVGSPTIENGVASNFLNNTNYIKLNQLPQNYNLEFKFKIKLTELSKHNDLFGIYMKPNDGQSQRIGGIDINASNKLELVYYYDGSQRYRSGTYSFQLNTDYYIKVIILKDSIKTYYSTDDINYILNYSSSENWMDFTMTGGDSRIGTGWGSSPNCHLRGSIDLNETYININGNAWFGTSFSRVKLHSPTAIAYTKVGNPTITSDGVASDFTDKTDYLTLPAFNPGTSKWKFTTKVKIYDYATQISLIDRNSSKRCFQIVVRTTGKFRVNISTNGSSKANEVDGTHVLSVNTIYYISFEYDGSKYYLKYSTDNINWTTDITINNSTKIYPVSSMCMGHSWYNSGTEKWNGEIYLRWTRFEINGVTNDKYKLHCLEGN